MLLHKSVVRDSRVRREAKALAAAGHDVTIVDLPPEPERGDLSLDGFRVVSATPPAAVRRLLPFHAYRLAFLAALTREAFRARPDVVHAHDAPMLAPGLLAARLSGARLVYDSHELATGVPYRERFWARLVAGLERIALPRSAAVITVSGGIAERLQQLYALRVRPEVVRNLPDAGPAAGERGGLRERLGIGSAPLVLHQGALAPRRGCETLVEAVARVPDAQLVFLGDPWPGYGTELSRLAERSGMAGRVHFVPSVPVERLLAHTREADVGVSLLSDDCENHRLALPNKVFEYIAAGVPVVVSDLPELSRLVAAHGVGSTADAADPAAVANALTTTLARRDELAPALARAGDELRWEREAVRLTSLYARLSDAPRALVLVRNAVTYDARVLREARLLGELGYDTTVVGTVSSAERSRAERIGDVRIVRLTPGAVLWRRQRPAARASQPSGDAAQAAAAAPRRTLRRLLVTLDWYRRGIALVRRTRPALVHCNDYNTMWIGVAAKLRGARVIYDSHELWPDRNLRPEPRPWLMACEALFVRVADEVVTTSPAYASVLARRYRIKSPTLVRNLPDWEPAQTTSRTGGPPTAVYFGAVTRHRGLEDAVRLLAGLPTLQLIVIGPEAWGFRSELEKLADELELSDRVEFRDPVRSDRTPEALSAADVGLALIEPVCLSYELTLPNKLFEYVFAGLPVLATRLPVVERVVREWGVGQVVSPGDQAAMVDGMEHLLDPGNNQRFRAACRAAASELTWAREREKLATVYEIPE